MSATLRVQPPSAAALIGVARRDITPPVGIYNRDWGAAKHDVAEGIHRPLSVTVLTFQKSPQDMPLVLTSLDAGWWREDEDEKWLRQTVRDALELDSPNLLLCLTHTHAACSICRGDSAKPGGHLIGPYLDHMAAMIIEAVREARANPQPAILTWATGRSDLATNRDLPDPHRPRVICGFNPQNPADDTVLVGRITAASGQSPSRVLATIVNYACHPTTLAWENRLISPDYVGAMREVVEAHTGPRACLFLQGASGELSPREQYVGDTAIADANGRRLGYSAIAALEEMLPPATALHYNGVMESGAPLATWARCPFEPSTAIEARELALEMPVKPHPTARQVEAELAACTDRTMAERIERKLRIIRCMGDGTTWTQPAWVWRLGDSFLVAHPNEAYSAFQIALRNAFPDRAVAVMNLVNGQSSYFSPPELYDLDIYQVWQSPFDRGALALLTHACEEQIRSLLE